MLRRRKTDLRRVKRSCGGEGGKCSLAFLVSRGISWGEDGPKTRDTCTWTSASPCAVVDTTANCMVREQQHDSTWAAAAPLP